MANTYIQITADVDTEDIIWKLTQLEHDEITDFIIKLDMFIADYDFTQNLINKLQKALDAEQD